MIRSTPDVQITRELVRRRWLEHSNAATDESLDMWIDACRMEQEVLDIMEAA